MLVAGVALMLIGVALFVLGLRLPADSRRRARVNVATIVCAYVGLVLTLSANLLR